MTVTHQYSTLNTHTMLYTVTTIHTKCYTQSYNTAPFNVSKSTVYLTTIVPRFFDENDIFIRLE